MERKADNPFKLVISCSPSKDFFVCFCSGSEKIRELYSCWPLFIQPWMLDFFSLFLLPFTNKSTRGRKRGEKKKNKKGWERERGRKEQQEFWEAGYDQPESLKVFSPAAAGERARASSSSSWLCCNSSGTASWQVQKNACLLLSKMT